MTTGTHLAARAAIAALFALVAGCGGGGGGGGGNPPPALNILTTTLPDGAIGAPYAHTVPVTGGSGGRTFTVSAGTLPAGLSLAASTGVISGTPNGPSGTANVTLTVTDSGSPAQSDAQAFSLAIAEALVLNIGVEPLATIGTPYSHTVTASGGTPPYTFTSGTLPSGLAMDAAGLVSGTPLPDAVSIQNNVFVRDSATPPQENGQTIRIVVDLEVATTSLPDATGGAEYQGLLVAQGGLPPYSWQLTGGSLPSGFPINGSILNGEVRFTPVAFCSPVTSTFDVQVSDSDSPVQTAAGQNLTLTVIKGPLLAPVAALPVARVGQPYSAFIRPALGVLPYAFTVSSGALPDGLGINAVTGEITGTPTTAGIGNFTILVTDDCGTTASGAFSMIVGGTPQGRNDSIATATVIGNGTFFASISPSGHPNTFFSPDEDYYSITTFAASTVTVDTNALGGGIDTVIELLNANGTRLNSCLAPAFVSVCVNDDETPGLQLDSFLQVRLNGPATFYVHVVEWRGDARPDLEYTIEISGVN